MINVRKGTAHSLAQTDFVGGINPSWSTAIVQGMWVYLDPATGYMEPGTSSATTAAEFGLLGFALTNQVEGDAIESGKIGAYALDGSSVLETDQFTGTYTLADVGKTVVADGSTAGAVKAVAHGSVSTNRVLGVVYAAPRVIYVGQTPITVLPIKLGTGVQTLT